MSSGYLGTHAQKRVISIAPDAIILVNGNTNVELCPKCKAQINLSEFVESITTSLSNNSTVGTAGISLAVPRHGYHGNYFIRGGRIYGVRLMDEIEIYIKGYFKVSGEYRYYRCFWGFITEIEESYSGGKQSIQISCQSILKWLQLMKTNEHPAIVGVNIAGTISSAGQAQITGKIYSGLNPYEIVYLTTSLSLLNIVLPKALLETLAPQPNDPIVRKEMELANYWKEKFMRIKSALRMFGADESNIVSIKSPDKNLMSSEELKQYLTQNAQARATAVSDQKPITVNFDNKVLMDWVPFFRFDESRDLDMMQNSYKDNLTIINEVKLFTGFEFYMDTTGDIIFKPPFWNLDVRDNPIYTVKDDELISWSITESEADIVTRTEVVGKISNQITQAGSVAEPRGIYTDYNLARRFGIRSQPIEGQFFTDPDSCYYHAISELDRINADRFRGSLTIVGRAELRLGYPIYIESKDCFVYIENISHNFSFGSQFTTNIQFVCMRRKYFGENYAGLTNPKDKKISSSYDTTGLLNIPGSSVALIAIDDLSKPADKQSAIAQGLNTQQNKAIKDNSAPPNEKIDKKVQTKIAGEENIDKAILVRHNMQANYVEKNLTDTVVVKLLAELDAAKKSGDAKSYLSVLDKIIPVSDENGYELIGIYEYGRAFRLAESGTLKRKGNAFSNLLQEAKNKKSAATMAPNVNKNVNEEPTSQSLEILNNPGGVVFAAYQAKSLAQLAPKQSVKSKGCSCTSLIQSGDILNPKKNEKMLLMKDLENQEKG